MNKIKQRKKQIDSLEKVAIFLEGYKQGKGSISPLGSIDLDNIWLLIKHLDNG